jgi:hypothetical protein
MRYNGYWIAKSFRGNSDARMTLTDGFLDVKNLFRMQFREQFWRSLTR